MRHNQLMRRVVYLHIGAPKTGTTYLQDRLTRNARQLGRHGVSIPTSSPMVTPALFHFRAALDLLGQDWGGPTGHARGAWPTLVRRIAKAHPRVVVSHEILAPATPAQIGRALSDLADHEVHVVYTARDLGRQLPAAWQESIKQGRKWTFARFLNRVERGNAWFARAFDLPGVLTAWGAQVPAERIHVVTVPQRAAAGSTADGSADPLWLRFCQVVGIDPAWAPLDSDRENRSLGVAETAVLRQLNRTMARQTRREASYDELIRELLAHQALAGRTGHRVTLPPHRFGWAEENAERWIGWLARSGVEVVGDPEDLRPRRPAPDSTWHNPDRVPPKQKYQAALVALAEITKEAASRPDPNRTLRGRLRLNASRLLHG